MNGDAFITRNGRYVDARATDQPSSTMLVRTVSKYTDGTQIDRPQLCVSLVLTEGDVGKARDMAERLDRAGYLPPTQPMSRAEWHQLMLERAGEHGPSEVLENITWDVCGRGLPIGVSILRAGVPRERVKTWRKRVRLFLRELRWTLQEDDDESLKENQNVSTSKNV